MFHNPFFVDLAEGLLGQEMCASWESTAWHGNRHGSAPSQGLSEITISSIPTCLELNLTTWVHMGTLCGAGEFSGENNVVL